MSRAWSLLWRSPRVRIALRLLVSLALLATLLSRVEWDALLALLPQMRWMWLAAPLALQTLAFGLSALRWRVVLHDLGLRPTLSTLLLVNLAALFWSQFLPTTVGGDGFRFWYMQHRYPRRAAVFASVFLDRLYGYLALLGVHTVLAWWAAPWWRGQPALRWLERALLTGVMIAAGLFFTRRRWPRLGNRLPRWLRPWWTRIAPMLTLLWDRSPTAVAQALTYSVAFVLTNGIMLEAYLRVVGQEVPLLPALYASTLAAVLGALPISLNGLGVREGAWALVLVPAGTRLEAVLMAALLQRLVNLALAALGGLWSVLGPGFKGASPPPNGA